MIVDACSTNRFAFAVDLLVGEDRPRGRASRRIADPGRVVADDQDAEVPLALERGHALQRDPVPERHVGRGDVDARASRAAGGRARASPRAPPSGSTWTALRVSSAMLTALRPVVTCARVTSAGRAAAEQRERVLDLVAEDLEHLLHALRAAEGEPVHRRPPDEDRARAERERHDDVGSSADAPVEVHLGPVADRLDDLGQRLERRDRRRRAAGRRGSRPRRRPRRARRRGARPRR